MNNLPEKVNAGDETTLWLDTLDGGRLRLGVNVRKGCPTTFHKQNAARAPSPA